MMRIKYFILLLIFTSSVSSQSYIDVVTLKNGDLIKGKIIENVINDHIRVELQGGSILTFQYDEIEKIGVENKSTRTFGSGVVAPAPAIINSPVVDCYNDGYSAGKAVSGAGPMIGGLAGGITLGLIGWGVSYLIVANGNPTPAYIETEKYKGDCKYDYVRGYKEGALKTKKSSVNIGGALGTLIIVVLLSGG
jgi:hypothetical protein